MKKNLILLIIIAIVAIGGVVAFVWSYNQMIHYRDNSEEIAFQAAEKAKSEQYQADEEIFNEKIKQPYEKFSGPADYGSVSFNYPRTWSAYNVKNDSSGYQVVFYPGVIPPQTNDTPVALKIEVINANYEDELSSHESAAKKGELTASPITIGQDQKGVMFNGKLKKDYVSSFVLLKLRDKTLLIQTDTDEYLTDFDEIILASFEYLP